MKDIKGSQVEVCSVQHTHLLTHTHSTSSHSFERMASSGIDSGRQFEVDPVSGQLFYREPMGPGGFYTPWSALEPSDYHPPRPASHNVSDHLRIYLLCTLEVALLSQVFNPGMHHPAPAIQGIPPNLPAQATTHVQEWRGQQAARRSARAYDPIRSRQVRSQEGGKGHGRTRGAANYRPREIEILLNYVEAELPVGGKGWNVIGARFREWAAISECPPRTDRSLEMKFKQVRPLCSPLMFDF